MEVIKEIVRFNEYDEPIDFKIIQKQKWLKKIRLASTFSNKGEQYTFTNKGEQ